MDWVLTWWLIYATVMVLLDVTRTRFPYQKGGSAWNTRVTARSSRVLIERSLSWDDQIPDAWKSTEWAPQLSRLESANSIRWGWNRPRGTPIFPFRAWSHQQRALEAAPSRVTNHNRGWTREQVVDADKNEWGECGGDPRGLTSFTSPGFPAGAVKTGQGWMCHPGGCECSCTLNGDSWGEGWRSLSKSETRLQHTQSPVMAQPPTSHGSHPAPVNREGLAPSVSRSNIKFMTGVLMNR